MNETEKDLKMKTEALESENKELGQQNRVLVCDLQRLQRDLKSIMAVNEEYQIQTSQLRDREEQYSELGREYREKLEQVKFERERIALKEEQFLRQIQKHETEKKSDVLRVNQKLTSQMQSRKREYDQKLEDIEDKLYLAQDEKDNMKRQTERIDRENHDLKKQVDTFIAKEDRTIQQYEKVIDQLKAEIKDKERQCHTIEAQSHLAKLELRGF